jgi:hypothetical protein
MGEPALPTEAELAATLDFAKLIVDSVRNDEDEGATGIIVGDPALDRWTDRVDLATFQLAQALVLATEERDNARRERDAFGYDRIGRLRTELVRLREVWNNDEGLLANHRFVTAVCALLDEVG